jgi:hypothetical protein
MTWIKSYYNMKERDELKAAQSGGAGAGAGQKEQAHPADYQKED